MAYRILAINPGSTSTKIAVFDDKDCILEKSINYTVEELDKYERIVDQFEIRKDSVFEALQREKIDLNTLSAIVGRGGVLPPVKSGAYLVNDKMIEYFRNGPLLEHASNLGCIIAKSIADQIGVNSYVYDSVAVDEMEDIARVTGIKGITRSSVGHALNTRAMALRYSEMIGKDYKSLNIIVNHVGGGSTVYLHKKGRMVDMISDDEGPFAPSRSGRIPGSKLVKLCYSGKYTYDEVMSMIRGKGGFYSLLGTVDAKEVEKRIKEGDEKAKFVYKAMVYQLAKGIGEMATAVNGDVDVIIITGGIAYSDYLTSMLKKRVEFISHVEIMPGENELQALAYGVLRVLNKKEEAWIF